MSDGLAAHIKLESLVYIQCLWQVELSVLSEKEILLPLSLDFLQLFFSVLDWICCVSAPS